MGQNAIVISFHEDGSEHEEIDLVPIEVEVAFSMPEKGIEGIVSKATLNETGRWTAGPFNLPIAGDWQVRLNLLITDFDIKKLRSTIRLRE